MAVNLIAATVPDSPGQPTMLESDKSFVTIGWTIAYNGGDDIDDYEVDWKIDTNDVYSVIKSTNNLNYFKVGGLQKGRLYHFRVRARNDVGLSESTT